MKKLLFFLLAAIAVITDARAQGHIQWSTREATPNMQANLFKGMATDRNGNTYTINFTQSSVNFYVTYRFFCYGANGVKKWQYNNDSCFTDCHDYYYAVVPLEIGGAIFVGVYEDLTGTAQVRIKRISANGHLVWQQYWNAPFMAGDIAAARLDQSGKLLIAFHNAFISSQTQENYALAKFDTATGLNTWHVELPDGGTLIQPLSETFTGMATDAGNNIYLTGTAYNPFTGTTINSYVFKMDPAGNLVYKQQTTGVNFAGSSDIHTDPAGNIYLLGMNNAGTGVAVEQRVAANGLFSWNKVLNHDSAFVEPVGFETMGGETYVVFNHHYFIPDSSIFGGGFNTNHHYSMARLAYNGTVRWTRDYLADFDINAVQFDQGGAAQMLACNNNLYVLSGLPLDDTSSYMLLQQIDTAGNSVWYDSTREDFGVGAMTTDDGCNIYVSRSARLGQQTVGNLLQKFGNFSAGVGVIKHDNDIVVYPNPVLDEIHISLPENFNAENAVATLYDNLGRAVAVQDLHTRTAAMPVQNLAAGIYYLSVTADGQRAGVKMLVKQ